MDLQSSKKTVLVKEPVDKFYIVEDRLYYLNRKGIDCMNLLSGKKEKLISDSIVDMYVTRQCLYYLEKNALDRWKVYALYKKEVKDSDLYPLSLTGNDLYTFMCDGNEEGKIHRISGSNSLRIYGKESKYLYLYEDELMFFSDGQFKKLNIKTFEIENISN